MSCIHLAEKTKPYTYDHSLSLNNMVNQKKIKLLALLTSILLSPYAQALDLNAGDYDPAPAGTTIANFYLQNGVYNSLYNGDQKVPGSNKLHTQIGIVSLMHYMDIGGKLAVPVALLPFGQLSRTVMGNNLGTDQGLSYMILGIPFWAYNNPKQQTYLVVAPFVYLPTGSYDSSRAVNLSDNRYRGLLQLAFSTQVCPKIKWDIAADATVYGDNRDAFGGGTLSQKLGYQLQTSARYSISPAMDVRAGISYLDAGDTKQNGVTTESNTVSKFWVGTGLWFSQKNQVIFTYGRDIKVENGYKNDNQINMKLMNVF